MKKNFGNNNRSSERSDKRSSRPDGERFSSRNGSGRSSDRHSDRPDRPEGRFSDSKKSDSERGFERKSTSSGNDRTEKRAYNPESRSNEKGKGRDRSVRNQAGDSFSSRTSRSDDRKGDSRSERKPFNSERKPFNADKPAGRRPFTSESSGERRSFNSDRSDDRKPFSERSGERKSFGNDRSDERSQRPGTDREKRGFSRANDHDEKRSDSSSERRSSYNRDEKRTSSFSSDKRPSRFGNPERDENASQRTRPGEDHSERASREERGERRSFGDAPDRKRSSFSGERSDSVRSSRFGNDRSQKKDPKVNSRFEDREDKKTGRSRTSSGEKYTPSYDLKRYKNKETGARGNTETKVQEPNAEEGVRLNRYIANAGVCSRRDADLLIESGEIKVNGKVVKEMGYRVNRGDVVKYGNRVLNREKLVYVLLNKPKDFITTTNDPDERKTVMDLVANACDQRIYPVGRLDRNTTGLLLLTNDGEIAEKLAHPSNEIKKVYQVELDRPITETDLEQIKQGLTLEDGPVKVDDIAVISPNGMVLGIELHSGRNRIVRRIFEHLNYEVVKLDRTVYAGLNKKDLARGNWRFLTEKEVIKLRYFS